MNEQGGGGQYAAAGVDLAGAESAKERIGRLVAGTRTALSVGEIGAFGGMVRVPSGMRDPVLVLGTDGVGTKVLVALAAGRLDTVGEDLVNHSVNDILVHAARPIAFMDYVAGAGLGVEQIAAIVEGIARGCRAHGMALAGGETAQMPGLYREGTFDLAGTIIGVVEKDEALHGDRIVPGDVVLLKPGGLVPADGRVIVARDFFVNQALLTGEPYPVEKHAGEIAGADSDLNAASNAVFMGTSVISGTASMLVCRTGAATAPGGISDSLAVKPPATAFESGIRNFGLLILRLAILMVLFVLLVNAPRRTRGRGAPRPRSSRPGSTASWSG